MSMSVFDLGFLFDMSCSMALTPLPALQIYGRYTANDDRLYLLFVLTDLNQR